ncbi:MAG: ribonuclease HII [Pseudobacteriovorax sp.]|nr:ribonuclease HII [Pseudobacteriovorax sp.]
MKNEKSESLSNPSLALNKGDLERHWLKTNYEVVGVDEVGRGCIAGPVVTAAVKLNYEAVFALPHEKLKLIRDSKKLSSKQRQNIITTIKDCSLLLGIGSATVHEIERFGIVPATFLAMRRALAPLSLSQNSMILVDGRDTIPEITSPQKAIIGGDGLCYCIAAASILAKESRDAFMRSQDKKYPDYGFEKNMGYGTAKHIEGLKKAGISPLHRKNFAPIRQMINHAQ